MEILRVTAGSEPQVKAAERLFDHPVVLETTRRFLQNDANHLLIAYVDDEPAGFVSGTEITHPDQSQPELFLNEPEKSWSQHSGRSRRAAGVEHELFGAADGAAPA